MEARIPTRVHGIPCQIFVQTTPYRPAYLWGPPENCTPAEGGDTEWVLLDRKGYPAPWLERKLDFNDYSRIEREIQQWVP